MRVLGFSESETESRCLFPEAGVGGKGNGICRLKGREFQFCRMKKVLERNVGDGCTTM